MTPNSHHLKKVSNFISRLNPFEIVILPLILHIFCKYIISLNLSVMMPWLNRLTKVCFLIKKRVQSNVENKYAFWFPSAWYYNLWWSCGNWTTSGKIL